MVTPSLKYTKKKQQQPCHKIEVPLKRKLKQKKKQDKTKQNNQKTDFFIELSVKRVYHSEM